jgi:hypothetical protein
MSATLVRSHRNQLGTAVVRRTAVDISRPQSPPNRSPEVVRQFIEDHLAATERLSDALPE